MLALQIVFELPRRNLNVALSYHHEQPRLVFRGQTKFKSILIIINGFVDVVLHALLAYLFSVPAVPQRLARF